MSDIRVEDTFFTRVEHIRFAKIVGDRWCEYLLRLRIYVAKHHHEDGCMIGVDKDYIEEMLGWKGEDGVLETALINPTIHILIPMALGSSQGTNPKKSYRYENWSTEQEYAAKTKERAEQSSKGGRAKAEKHRLQNQ